MSLPSLFFNAGYAENTPKEMANKKIVTEFYNDVINKKDFNLASKFLGPYYRQHSPLAADGSEGLKNFIDYLKKNFPHAHNDIKQIFADGDYVILHVHAIRIPGTRGRVNFDLFKLGSVPKGLVEAKNEEMEDNLRK